MLQKFLVEKAHLACSTTATRQQSHKLTGGKQGLGETIDPHQNQPGDFKEFSTPSQTFANCGFSWSRLALGHHNPDTVPPRTAMNPKDETDGASVAGITHSVLQRDARERGRKGRHRQ